MVNHHNKRKNIFFGLALAAGIVCVIAGKTTAAETTTAKNNVAPLKVLMVTGGSSHDYDNQKNILEKGI
ncbi:MAG: hypothetical protein OSA92_11880, partial [Pirellulaceae bacterium]|nr:hypothetical protein [Pirellulaceae bacterium]